MPKPNLKPNLTNIITKIMPKPNLETTPTWSKDLQQMESYWAKGISGEKTGYLKIGGKKTNVYDESYSMANSFVNY